MDSEPSFQKELNHFETVLKRKGSLTNDTLKSLFAEILALSLRIESMEQLNEFQDLVAEYI